MTRAAQWTIILAMGCALLAGCAGPGPQLFPVTPMEVRAIAGGGLQRWYDTTKDGHADYCEELSPQGRVVAIGYGCDAEHLDLVKLDEVPKEEYRHLMLLLDSVPYSLVHECWTNGRFRYCHKPSRTIAPFPVMTDLSFSEFLGTSPSPGIESSYFDGKKLTDGYDVYAHGGNVPWERDVDYVMSPLAHPSAYLDPYPWFDHELYEIQNMYMKHPRDLTVGYSVGTSAVGASQGRNGHEVALTRVDRYCQWLMYKTRGRARFTLLSDHGHAFYDSKRIPLPDILKRFGYRVKEKLKKPNDVVVPEFGMVSCAAIHTHMPARVAADVVGIDGVALSSYMEGDTLIVLSRAGKARITQSSKRFKYKIDYGDPLRLNAIIKPLLADTKVSDDGYIDDRALFRATINATYPDAVARLWRAFHGLVEHTPDVLISTDDGYHCGSAAMTSMITLIGVHGSLRQMSSGGFVMTTEGDLPPVMRMADLKPALLKVGVPFHDQ